MRRCSAAVLFLLILSVTAMANDSAMGGAGAQIFPMDTTDVALVRETVRLTETRPFEFDVEAALTFRNDADKSRTLKLGFPLFVDPGDWGSDLIKLGKDTLIDKFRVDVNGKPAAVALVKDPKAYPSEDGTWNAIYTFKATFAPHAETTITHRYRTAASRDAMGGAWVYYVFETGSRWKNSIERAEFVVVFRGSAPPNIKLSLGETTLVGPGRAPAGKRVQAAGATYEAHYTGGPKASLRVVFHDVKPTKNLTWSWQGAGPSLPGGPPIRAGGDEIECSVALSEFLDADKPTPKLTDCYDKDVLRNIVYASRGYAFQNKKWTILFYGGGLFFPSTEPYSESWLSPAEKNAAAALK